MVLGLVPFTALLMLPLVATCRDLWITVAVLAVLVDLVAWSVAATARSALCGRRTAFLRGCLVWSVGLVTRAGVALLAALATV